MPKLSEDTDIIVPLKNLVAIIVAVALSAAAYYSITNQVNFLEHQQSVIWEKTRFLEGWINTFEPSESIQRAMAVQQEILIRIAVLEEKVKELEGE